MSRTLFATRFRAATGQSLMRYLAKVRLGRAAGYLRTADLSIDTIAIRTGYGNNASPSRAFKRELGISPGAYRRSRGEAASPAGLIAVGITTEPTPPHQPSAR